MARINTTQLIHHATGICSRVNEVQKDPAVQKAWAEAARDLGRAAKSVAHAGIETRSAWRRAEMDGGLGFTGAFA